MRVFKLDQEFKSDFVDLLLDDFGPKLLVYLGEIVPYDKDSDLVLALIALYNSKIPGRNIMHLVNIFISRELDSNKSINTLFRDNSMGSLLITTIFKQCGHSYLRGCLAKYIKKICNLKESLEIDPNRTKPGTDVIRSSIALQSFSEKILFSIYKSVESCPDVIKRICWLLKTRITEKYPENDTFVVLTGFMFLRFFCPAIFDPNYWGLVKTIPTKEGRRALVLVSKIIQVLANNASFGEAHDSHLIGLNSFLDEQRQSINEFINDLASTSAPVEPTENEFHCKHPLSTVVLYLQKHFITIEDKFTSSRDLKNVPAFERFRELLSRVDIFDENEFIEAKPKQSSEPKHLKLRRVLSSTFLDTFSSADDYKDRHQIRDDSFSFQKKRRASANEITEDTVINPIFGVPLECDSLFIRSDGLLPSPRSTGTTIKLSDSAPVRAESVDIKGRKGSKSNHRFRRLGRSRTKGEKKASEDREVGTGRTVEEENEILRNKVDSLRLQVQMLGERNADLRLQNHTLKRRNETLEKRSQPGKEIRPVVRQTSSPTNIS